MSAKPLAVGSDIPSPSPAASNAPSQGNISITGIYQPACSSPSCQSTTTLVLNGGIFTPTDVLTAQGKKDGQSFKGTITKVNGDGTQIIYDLLNLPCQSNSGIISDPTS